MSEESSATGVFHDMQALGEWWARVKADIRANREKESRELSQESPFDALWEQGEWLRSLLQDGRALYRYRRHLLGGGLSVALEEELDLFGEGLSPSQREQLHAVAQAALLTHIDAQLAQLAEHFKLPPLPVEEPPSRDQILKRARRMRRLSQRIPRLLADLAPHAHTEEGRALINKLTDVLNAFWYRNYPTLLPADVYNRV